jgi:hypothetical protein
MQKEPTMTNKIAENQTAHQAQIRLNQAAIGSLQPGSSLAYVRKLEQYAAEWVARIRERRIAMEDEAADALAAARDAACEYDEMNGVGVAREG